MEASVITSKEIEEQAKKHWETYDYYADGDCSLDLECQSGIFKDGAQWAQKTILERASKGFDEWLLMVPMEEIEKRLGNTSMKDGMPRYIWDSARLSAEKEIAEIENRYEKTIDELYERIKRLEEIELRMRGLEK